MKNTLYKKILLTFFVIEIIITSSVSPNIVSADVRSSILSDLINTGDSIKADIHNTSTSQTAVSNTNQADVNQAVNATANTGDNEASRNISIGGNAGIIDTGDATVNVQGVANTNNNVTGVSGNGNGTTTNSASSTQTTAVHNGNKTLINQAANTLANTGGNKADRNISVGGQAGVITTGNASTNTSFLTTGNGSVTLVGGDSDGNGPGSGASIVRNSGDSSTVSQSCGVGNLPGLVIGLSGCSVNTGDNTSNRGISRGGDAGVIETGDAQVNVLMYAIANKNNTGVSGGNATAINNSNTASVNQQANADANTGRNTANRNISIGGSAGVIKTGNAAVNVFIFADLNSSYTGCFLLCVK